MILNQSQADAVYSAMCALNNVGGRVDTRFVNGMASVIEVRDRADRGVIVLFQTGGATRDIEKHINQAAFAAAYGLQ